MLAYEKHTLPNGVRVLLAPNDKTEAVTLAVFVGVGSRYETARESGLSHFLEHLFFKGTRRRPRPEMIARELDARGAAYNAYTSKEETGFWIKLSAKDFPLAVDVLADMMTGPKLDPDEVERERGVIIEEINMYEDDPRRRTGALLEATLYGRTAMGRDIIGTKETVKNLTRVALKKHHRRHYIGSRMVISAAGRFEPEAAKRAIARAFARVPAGHWPRFTPAPRLASSPRFLRLVKPVDQTHLGLGFRAWDMFDSRRYALAVLSIILGGCMSSRLFREIRDKRGLAYYVSSYPDLSYDCGYFGVRLGVKADKAGAALRSVGKILRSLRERGVGTAEFERAKDHLRGSLALQFETTDDIASYLGGQELHYGRIISPEETLARLQKVEKRDMLKAMQILFRPNRLALVSVARDEREEGLKTLLASL